MKERNKSVPCVFLVLQSGGRVLLMRRHNTGYQDGMLSLPSGHIEAGETPLDAMVREAREELGIEISKSYLDLVHVCYRPRHDETGDRSDYIFQARDWQGTPKIGEPSKCSELSWAGIGHLPLDIIPHNKDWIIYWSHGVFYSELTVEYFKTHGLYTLKEPVLN